MSFFLHKRKAGRQKGRIKMLKKHYENLLMSKINENGGHVTRPDEIWDNQQFLVKRVQRFEEEVCYLPLPIKKMLAYIHDPNRVIEYSLSMSDDGMLTCDAYVHWSNTPEGTIAGRGQVSRYLDQIFPNNLISEHERKSVWNQSVISLAISRALTDAGIGMEFYGDCFDFSVDALETDEMDASKSRVEESKVEKLPEVPTANEKKERRRNAQKEKATEKVSSEVAPTQTNSVSAPEKVDVPEKVDTTTPVAQNTSAEKQTVPTEAPATTLSLDQAKAIIADKGTYEGNELGRIYERAPRAIIWLYLNSDSADVKNAAGVLISQDEVLKNMLNK